MWTVPFLRKAAFQRHSAGEGRSRLVVLRDGEKVGEHEFPTNHWPTIERTRELSALAHGFQYSVDGPVVEEKEGQA